ncbi:hypothetical protein ABE61_07965 [Lysinibacillus sphaericus]|uniref:hypothetical protein n=1 Tax=Lysinibacillus sphaericus TaxID=1421 RepID=UPI0018CE1598|nr:hypothetical protein [Lysinibacillus sphaericus]MBG9454015.1 hypothetical protein [Lysinibacillus sphaericus]MBG9478432.1 hypothetical protein [Lysinibacillus sphaericus]MBG9592081.1 hypothetical protein [Lysinibacillus sphaericus]
MLKEGLVRHHSAGGIAVNFNTGSVISSKSNNENPHIRAIGYITSGNYFVVNNLEFITRIATSVAEDLVIHIKNNVLQLI